MGGSALETQGIIFQKILFSSILPQPPLISIAIEEGLRQDEDFFKLPQLYQDSKGNEEG